MEHGPQLEVSEATHAWKYRGEGEPFKEAMNRVAGVLAPGDEFKGFRDILLGMRFMPAGRVQSAIGSTRQTTPYNCYVSGTIEDSYVHGHGSIMARASEAAQTMRMGGGIGYDFSTLRPRGDLIKKLQSQSSGPISFMRIFDAVCLCTASSGHRRGAQMGILRVDHPDIEEFVRAKQNSDKLNGFNMSIAVTDEFMEAVRDDKPFVLRWGGKNYQTIQATALWDLIMRSTWDWAEPGVIFIDKINKMNNLLYCETIAATNPCGEQPLPPYGACLLGSFNLVKYVVPSGNRTISVAGVPPTDIVFDWNQFIEDIPKVVRAMDRVVDAATYPLYEQEQEAHSKRRMGLGVTGLANALEAVWGPYGSPVFLKAEAEILRVLRDEAYRASAMLAKEKGAFPAYKDEYSKSPFIQTLSDEVRDLVMEHGTRNSHLLSIAPTGTISLCADNVSSGIEPVFDYEVDRTIETFDGPEIYKSIPDYGMRVFKVYGKRASEVTAEEHLAVLTVASQFVDSSVSKTCNVPKDIAWEDFKGIYMKAWESNCKGCTTYRIGGKRGTVLESSVEEEEMATSCYIDEATGRHECE